LDEETITVQHQEAQLEATTHFKAIGNWLKRSPDFTLVGGQIMT